jgi:hypothetical protein
MDSELIKKTIKFAKNVGYVIIATCDRDGKPHIATAGKLRYDDGDNNVVRVSEWFCTKTVENLHLKGHISVVAWEPGRDIGYQLLGKVLEIQNNAVLNGYTPKEDLMHVPQTRHELAIEVEKITEFSHAVHNDENLMQVSKGTGR